jgi:hypothetical protein
LLGKPWFSYEKHNKFKPNITKQDMEEGQPNYSQQDLGEIHSKLRDLEEKQQLSKERVLMLGKNLVEYKEENRKEQIEIKKDLEQIKDNLKRMKAFLELISEEFSKFAKKEDLEILSKQAKMFQPI